MAKRKGKHPGDALSSIQVRYENRLGGNTDGGCLYIVVDGIETKRWEPRTTADRRHRDFGLGSERVIPTAQVPEAAVTCVCFSKRSWRERVSQ